VTVLPPALLVSVRRAATPNELNCSAPLALKVKSVVAPTINVVDAFTAASSPVCVAPPVVIRPTANVKVPVSVNPPIVKLPLAITRTPVSIAGDVPGMVTEAVPVLTSKTKVMPAPVVNPSAAAGPTDWLTVRRAATPPAWTSMALFTARSKTVAPPARNCSVAAAVMVNAGWDTPLITWLPAVNVNVPLASVMPPSVKLPVAITRTPTPIAGDVPGMVTEAEPVLTSKTKVMPAPVVNPSAAAGPTDWLTVRRAATPPAWTSMALFTARSKTVVPPARNCSVAAAVMVNAGWDTPLITWLPAVNVNVPLASVMPPRVKLPVAITRTPRRSPVTCPGWSQRPSQC
jgi:hypothetical protein